jgi:hypothetical protein
MARKVLLLLFAALLMPACIDDFEQVAVTVNDEGTLRVLHHPCSEHNVVFSLRLMVPIGNIIADGDDIVLWKVVAVRTSTSSLVEVFEPGNVPAGYRETVPLEIPGKGDEVVIYLDTRWSSDGGIALDWGSLSPGTLLTEDGPKSRSQWLEYAIKGCGGT